MPNLRVENAEQGSDFSWLGSDHGRGDARTGVLDISAFTAGTHYPDGFIPSGTPVNRADSAALKPWTGGAGEKLGFVVTNQTVHGAADLNVPYLAHGIIKPLNVPGTFTVPTAGAEGFSFIGGVA